MIPLVLYVVAFVAGSLAPGWRTVGIGAAISAVGALWSLASLSNDIASALLAFALLPIWAGALFGFAARAASLRWPQTGLRGRVAIAITGLVASAALAAQIFL